jgi:hypothetical protein
MFKFPDAESGEEEGFGPGKGAGSGHDVFAVVAVGAATWATRFFAGLMFPDGPGGGAGDVELAAIHIF